MTRKKEQKELCYRIAELNVKMNSFGRIIEQSIPYLSESDSVPDFVITSNWPQVREKYPMLSDSDGEYLFTGISFYRQLLNFNGMMLHASAVVVDEKAYLFSANSGTGKSTHTKLWLEHFGNRAYILNDDKPALRLQDGIWYAYGTPWSGKHDISVNTGVPVAGIAMIERGETNEISLWGGKDAISSVFSQVNHPKDMAFRIKLLELLDRLFADVPIWKLRCNMDPDAMRVSYEAMSGKKL